MTTEEINRYIHEQIMEKCWHDYQNDCHCQKPNCFADNSFYNQNPDYCSDDSPRSLLNEVEAKVIELLSLSVKNPNVIYCRYLMAANGFSYDDLGYLYEQVIRATAEQRARACVEAHKEAK